MKNSVYQTLQSNFYSSVLTNCPNTAGSLACLNAVPVSTLLAATDNFIYNGGAQALDPSVGVGEPLRPHDGDGGLIQFTLTTTYPSTQKPLFVTSNRNDAAQEMGTELSFGFPESEFTAVVDQEVGDIRAVPLISSNFYDPNSTSLVQPYVANGDVTRQALDRLGTDLLWRWG